MIQPETVLLQEFTSNVDYIANIITDRLCESFGLKSIGFNLSSLLHDPILCLFDEANSNCLSVKNSLKLFIEKWEKEIRFQNEMLQLKNQIYESFNMICNELQDKIITDILLSQQLELVQLLFNLARFDHYQKAGDFCKGMISGFDVEALNKIQDYVIYLIWEPFPAFIPSNIIEFITKICKNIINYPKEENVSDAMSKIKTFVQEQFISINLKLNEIESSEKFESSLKELVSKQRQISVLIETINNSFSIIQKYRPYISSIKFKTSPEIFLQGDILFTFEELELYISPLKPNYNLIMRKLPRTLKELHFIYRHKNQMNSLILITEIVQMLRFVKKIFLKLLNVPS